MSQTNAPAIHRLGIRHHGPGSARNLKLALDTLQPDLVLLELPADLQAAIPLAAHTDMMPPVALLAYNPARLSQASFYPFARYSPEWVAIQHCQALGIHLQCFDLPVQYMFGLRQAGEEDTVTEGAVAISPEKNIDSGVENETAVETAVEQAGTEADGKEEVLGGDEAREDEDTESVRQDPLAYIAQLEGYTDGERWWEARIEAQPQPLDMFGTVEELMVALRGQLALPETEETLLREAHMREVLRGAIKQGYRSIAIVCGAWHVPALHIDLNKKTDKELLKGLKKEKVAHTWIPWTYERLSAGSGYGAGVISPAWYEMLYDGQAQQDMIARWAVQAARLMRDAKMEVSSAHAIEAVRLSHTLAQMRGMPLPGLDELMEAAQAVYCGGHSEPLALVARSLVIGTSMGSVPAEAAAVPLQQNLTQLQQKLKLKPDAAQQVLELDLRKENHLERSKLLHRLRLLNIHWGVPRRVHGKSGTFHEHWDLEWKPEFALHVIEAGMWGNTVLEAATSLVLAETAKTDRVADAAALLQRTLAADLPLATQALAHRLQDLAAQSRDVLLLMDTLPPLAQVMRYGSVRQTDAEVVQAVVHQVVPRICIGMPALTLNLTEEAERTLWAQISAVDQAIKLLDQPGWIQDWQQSLDKVIHLAGASPLICGGTVRTLMEASILSADETALHLSRALSPAAAPLEAARWVEGFVSGGALLLLHNPQLMGLLDAWLGQLPEDGFRDTVALLRRAFSQYAVPERQKLYVIATRPQDESMAAAALPEANHPWAAAVLEAYDAMLALIFPPNT